MVGVSKKRKSLRKNGFLGDAAMRERCLEIASRQRRRQSSDSEFEPGEILYCPSILLNSWLDSTTEPQKTDDTSELALGQFHYNSN